MCLGIVLPFRQIAHHHIQGSNILCSGMRVETPSLLFPHVLCTTEVKARYALAVECPNSFSHVKQDGLPMICIILRNIDIETADYDLLLFGYLKVLLTFISVYISLISKRLQAVCGTDHLAY
jgi:hypothetical protein